MPVEDPFPQDMVVGDAVLSATGEHVGVVQDVRTGAFKVDAPMRRDYWLSTRCIRMTESGRVVLSVDRDHLDAYRVSVPPPDFLERDKQGETRP